MTSRVYYRSRITGPQGARFFIYKSNHSTEVINKAKSRLHYDQDVVKIYVEKGEPPWKKEQLEFYDIEESMNIVEAIETVSDDNPVYVKKIKALDIIMDRCGVVYDKEQDRLVENRDPDYKV
tara:strand:- start:2194 stop:2559 length:366 start_codon:yes stop_codon:yes gene_type:complete